MGNKQVLGRADSPPPWDWRVAALGVTAPGRLEKVLPEGRTARANLEEGPFLAVFDEKGQQLDEEVVVPAD